jgi:hypothetical protein
MDPFVRGTRDIDAKTRHRKGDFGSDASDRA